MPAAAFFDLDKTLWPYVGEKAFAYHQLARGIISLKQLLKILGLQIRYDLHLIDGTETLKRKILHELFSNELVDPCLSEYNDLFVKKLTRAFFPEMLDRIQRHRDAGHKIVMISATIDFIALPAATFLQADECYSTILETRNGCFTGEVCGSIPFGEAKAKLVRDYTGRNGIDLKNCYAYGDHWADRHMLAVVGNPVAVNPDRRLRKFAQQNNWKTEIFTPKLAQ